MSSYFDPESPPPPPSQSASFRQIILMLAFGAMGSVFVISAIRSQPGNSLGVGAVLIMCAFIFFAGLISRRAIIETIASGLLLIGAGVLVAMTIQTRDWLWGLGAVFFALCIVVIQMKQRFKDQATPNAG